LAGLVAIIAHDRERAIAIAELDDLLGAYRSLREEHQTALAPVAPRVLAAKVVPDWAAPPSIEGTTRRWRALVGPARGDEGAPLGELDGQFALISYDEAADEVVVSTDPFGMQSVFTAERDGKTYVSTSALCLARHLRAAPSVPGLLAFLRSGYQFGSATNWDGIERLEPGTRLRVNRAGRARDIYWRPAVEPSPARLSLRQAADRCIEVAVEDLRHQAAEARRWSDLTGGFDSRLLNLLLRAAGVAFSTNTVGAPDDLDVRVARRVAAAAGWEWSRFDPEHDGGPLGFLRPALAWGDGHLEVVQLARVLSVHARQGPRYRGLFNGGGGEHFRSYAWTQEFMRAGRSQHVNFDNWLDMRMLAPMDTSIFRRDPTREVRADFRSRGAAWVEPLSSEPNTAKLDALYAYKSTGHFGAYHSAAAGLLVTELPFYRKRPFSAAHSVPYRLRDRHRLMREMIVRLDPSVALIETEPGGPAAPWRPSRAWRFLPYYARIARKAAWKLRGRAWGPSASPFDPDGAAVRQAILRSIAGDDPSSARLRCAPLFDASALNDLLRRASEPQFAEPSIFGRIVTVELSLREVDASLDAVPPR
jgi:hypothetical protein